MKEIQRTPTLKDDDDDDDDDAGQVSQITNAAGVVIQRNSYELTSAFLTCLRRVKGVRSFFIA